MFEIFHAKMCSRHTSLKNYGDSYLDTYIPMTWMEIAYMHQQMLNYDPSSEAYAYGK